MASHSPGWPVVVVLNGVAGRGLGGSTTGTEATTGAGTPDSHAAAKSSPHLEVFRKHGVEVLLLSDRVDDWMVAQIGRAHV